MKNMLKKIIFLLIIELKLFYGMVAAEKGLVPLSDEVRRDKLLPLFKKLYEEALINTFNCRDRCIVASSNCNK